MKALQNDTLLRALLNKPVDYTPIWIMRQAGRAFARIPGIARANKKTL